MIYTYDYNSPLGKITMASEGETLSGLWFEGQKYFADTIKSESEKKLLPVFDETIKLRVLRLKKRWQKLCSLSPTAKR